MGLVKFELNITTIIGQFKNSLSVDRKLEYNKEVKDRA